MLSGELYNASDQVLSEERNRARLLTKRYNDSSVEDEALRKVIISDLIGEHGEELNIEPPFYCDYGSNITLGNSVFFNIGCVILDVAPVTVGDYVLFGPNVNILTATHPKSWKERGNGLELGSPISIGNYAWLGGSCVICQGVTIGERSIIGAGSVVTKNIPPDVFAAGNPCKIIKDL